jgi:hypothetical protein
MALRKKKFEKLFTLEKLRANLMTLAFYNDQLCFTAKSFVSPNQLFTVFV